MSENTIQFKEFPDSRSATADREANTRTLHYWLSGIQDDFDARSYVDANAPPIFDGYFAQNAEMDTTGVGLWDVVINYGALPKNEANEVSFTFGTEGGTAHITQAKQHISHTAAEGAAEDHFGAINVTKDGVEGVDIAVSQFSWTENWTLPISYASFSAALIYKVITGTVNATEFRGFGEGQVLFDGVQGGASNRDPTLAQLSFRFSQSDDTLDAMPNVKPNIVKGGWEYIWAVYEKEEDTTADRITQHAVSAHVERVYDYKNFGQLGIGTGLL